MRIPLSWLNSLLTPTLEPLAIEQALLRIGLEVESLERVAPGLETVVVGQIVAITPHPNADKLRVCQTDLGDGTPVQIVTGAPNVQLHDKIPVAKVGSVLPGDKRIEAAKLRGVESFGMYCSLVELGLPPGIDGVHILPPDTPIGLSIAQALQLGEWVLDLAITANRPDLLAVEGVARELAVATPETQLSPVTPNTPKFSATGPAIRLGEIASARCPLYRGITLRGVQVGPSPDWLVQRLQGSGLRSINNVVDATNYVMLLTGHPTHAFDANQLQGSVIHVRPAAAGENITTLDGTARVLTPEDLVVADAERALVVAGVMGGQAAEVTSATTDLFLECAYFEPSGVRRTSRRLNLSTDSSYRFERGVNPVGVERALNLLVQVIQELAGGVCVGAAVESRQTGFPSIQPFEFHLDAIERLAGIGVPNPEVERILRGLGYTLRRHTDGVFELNAYDVNPPGWRWHDTTREVDLVEEVIRHWGYDKIPAVLPPSMPPPEQPPSVKVERRLRAVASALGLCEVMTRSLSTLEAEKRAGLSSAGAVTLSDPLKDMAILRTSLLPGLLEVLQHNRRQGVSHMGIFELGRTYTTANEERPQEKLWLGGAVMGALWDGLWLPEHTPAPLLADFAYAKGLLESIFTRLEVVHPLHFRQAESLPGLHPGRSAELLLNERVVGILGEVHPSIAREYDLPAQQPTSVFLLDLDAVTAHPAPAQRWVAFSRQPAMLRDLAVLVPESLTAAEALGIIQASGGEWLEHVTMFDRFAGPGIPSGQVSLGFSLVYRAADRTLTAGELEPVHQHIIDQLHQHCGAVLRT